MRRTICILLTGSSLGMESPALAQDAPQPVADTSDIVVTAQRREQRLQDVPMSITVIGNKDIERRDLRGMEDYLRGIPGTNQIDTGSQSNAIVIRGITTAPMSENVTSGSTVGTYFGETPITGAGGLGASGIDIRPVDLARIEVLRGPQGVTFGSATLSGALRIIPVRPRLDKFEGRISATASETAKRGSDNSMVQGIVNAPLVRDVLAVRLIAYRYDDSGFYTNSGGSDPGLVAIASPWGLDISDYRQRDVGRMRTVGMRASALFQPTTRLSLYSQYLVQKIEQDGVPVASSGDYRQSRLPVAEVDRVRNERGEASDNKIHLFSTEATYDAGFADWATVLSSVRSGSRYGFDYSPYFFLPISSGNVSTFHALTAETRLASHAGPPLQYVGGLFYENVHDKYNATLDWAADPSTNFIGTNPMYLDDQTSRRTQKAIFGELSYKFFDRLTVAGGARYFHYDKRTTDLQEGGFVNVPIGGGVATRLSNREGGTIFRGSMTYNVNHRSSLYATWSQGFRLGRPDPGALPQVCDQNGDGIIDETSITLASTRTIKSDRLNNYEVGAKVALLGNQLNLQASAFHIDWKGLPVRTTVFGTCGYTANAGAAKSDGVELQAQLSVAKGLTFSFGGGYTNARLSRDAPNLFAQAGARLPGSPKFSANASGQYDFELFRRPAFARFDGFYTGAFYGDLRKTRLLRAGDYVKVDVSTGIDIRNLSLELFVHNLTNSNAFTWRPGPSGEFSGYQLRPRTIGVGLGYNFR
jgi:outer membrane receptor protein involved in Fe transport